MPEEMRRVVEAAKGIADQMAGMYLDQIEPEDWKNWIAKLRAALPKEDE